MRQANHRKYSLKGILGRGLFFMGIMGVTGISLSLSPLPPRTLRPLQGDERAVLWTAFDRIVSQNPVHSNALTALKRQLELAVLEVGNSSQAEDLIQRENNKLIFSEDFFSADSVTQVVSLLHITSPKYSLTPAASPNEPDIAYSLE